MSNIRRKLRVWPNDFVSLRSRNEKELSEDDEEVNSENNDNNNINNVNNSGGSSSNNSTATTNTNSTDSSDSSSISEINTYDTMAANNKTYVTSITRSLNLTGLHPNIAAAAAAAFGSTNDEIQNDEDDEVTGWALFVYKQLNFKVKLCMYSI